MGYRTLTPFALLALAVQAQPLPEFEVASVHITPHANLGYISFPPFGGNRYTLNNATLEVLVQLAYNVPFEQISGREKLGSEHYDLSAKAEDGVLLTYEQLEPRLQRLLEQRFKLSVHREHKDFDGYALVVAKGGPKLHPTKGGPSAGSILPGGLRLSNFTLSRFATSLRSPAGRPVIDKTGIGGSYDFELDYARDTDTDSALPSFFTALQEQFGLKLEKAKVPLEVVVIDSVQKIPSEN